MIVNYILREIDKMDVIGMVFYDVFYFFFDGFYLFLYGDEIVDLLIQGYGVKGCVWVDLNDIGVM